MGTVWDRTTEFCSGNLASIMPIAVLLIFLPLSIQGNLAPLAAGSSAAAMLLIRLLNLAMAILSLAGQLAIVALAIDPRRTAGQATAVARARVIPTMAMVLILMAGAAVVVAPALAMTVAAGIDPMSMASLDTAPAASVPPSLAYALIGYGGVAGLVLLWIAARIALLYPVVVVERRGTGALARSFALTRGLALAIIGVMLLYAVVSTVAVLATKAVFGSVLAIVAGGTDPLSIGSVVTATIVGAVTTAFTVLGAAFTTKLYLAASASPDTPVIVA